MWFHGLHRTITDNYIRHIIPIDYETGLIMISYTDGELANMWSQLDKLGKKTLVERLHKQVKKVLNKDPPEPTMISTRYWSGGVHMWKPGYNVKETYETLLKPTAAIKNYNQAINMDNNNIDLIYRLGMVLYQDNQIKITFSGGVAHTTESRNASDLVNKADERLYEAKKSGRDQIV